VEYLKEIQMKPLTRIFAIAAIGFASICAFVNPASAQNAFQGSFTLAHEIRWQSAVLPAGDYTFAMESTAMPCTMIVRGPNGATFELSSSTDNRTVEGPSVLILERRNGDFYVRELYMADRGLHVFYNVPKGPKSEKLLAQGPTSTERVLIASAK
jgi:hypothetical protein